MASLNNTPSPSRDWMRYEDAARYIGISERSLRRLVSNRRVPFTKLGLATLFDPAALDTWVHENSFSPERSE